MKKFLYFLGCVVAAVIVWRIVKRFLVPPASALDPRSNLTTAQKALDDNAPMYPYAWIVPPIAQNVQPNAGAITLKRNDPVYPFQYTLPAMGPNGNT